MDNNFNFYLPTKVITGIGQINALSECAKEFGSDILLITPSSLSHINSKLLSQLNPDEFNLTIEEIDDGEPTINFINAMANRLRGNCYDLIIGFGGGSSIDVAKSLSIALTHHEDIWLYANLSNRPPLPLKVSPIPVIAIPTTSGTGAEVTPYAVLTKEDTFQKGTIQERAIFPRVAILDPEFMITLPTLFTASTGIDAFAHALEASINISKNSPAAETFGHSAMRIILKWLPVAVDEPENIKARMKMAWASCLSGMAIAHRGTTTAHSIAEPLGGLTHIQHGLGVSMSTLPVMRHTINKDPKCLARLNSIVLGISLNNKRAAAENFLDKMEDMFNSVNLNKCVKDFLPNEKCKDLEQKLIDNILKFKFRPLLQHPIEFDGKSLKPIIHEIVNGKKYA